MALELTSRIGLRPAESSDPVKIAALDVVKERAVKRKWRPSGRKKGQRWLASARLLSSWVTGRGVLPAEETTYSVLLGEGANTIIPSEFQEPPRPLEASQIISTGPPAAAIFFILPATKKPI